MYHFETHFYQCHLELEGSVYPKLTSKLKLDPLVEKRKKRKKDRKRERKKEFVWSSKEIDQTIRKSK